MVGRKPLPSAVLVLAKGKLYSDQKDRSEAEPKADEVIEPRCPNYFRPSEREAWEYLATILKNYSIYIDINAPLLEIAAVYLAEFRNSQWDLFAKGRKIKVIKSRNKSAELLIKILVELNISASGVARLGAAVVKGKKGKEEFFED